VAVTHNQRGDPTALVVNAQNKVELRSLVTERAIGDKWLVMDGLKAGDRVIVEGLQFAKPGATVKPEELQSAGAPAAAAPAH
jgi:membrane fusion protein (multidrug efflux system)